MHSRKDLLFLVLPTYAESVLVEMKWLCVYAVEDSGWDVRRQIWAEVGWWWKDGLLDFILKCILISPGWRGVVLSISCSYCLWMSDLCVAICQVFSSPRKKHSIKLCWEELWYILYTFLSNIIVYWIVNPKGSCYRVQMFPLGYVSSKWISNTEWALLLTYSLISCICLLFLFLKW